MKCFKMLGLAAVAASALMAFAGSASATELTSPTGTQYGGTIKAELRAGTQATLASSFIGEVVCGKIITEGKVGSQGAGVTAKIQLSTFDMTECNGSFTTLKPGTLEIHGEGNYNGILTSSGTEVTTELFGLHCIFTTNNTSLGTITGGTPSRLVIASAAIPRTGGRSGIFCGSSASWNAEYNFSTPSTLLVD